jgi:hypothetical protein
MIWKLGGKGSGTNLYSQKPVTCVIYEVYNMPAQSCLLPVDGYSGLDLVPFISENHPDAIHYALGNSLLTMSLHNY